VGIWVTTSAGDGKWATRTTTSDPSINNYRVTIDSSSKWVAVTVGCGGTTDRWERSIYGQTNTTSNKGVDLCLLAGAGLGFVRL
jgi:hypothetical protein